VTREGRERQEAREDARRKARAAGLRATGRRRLLDWIQPGLAQGEGLQAQTPGCAEIHRGRRPGGGRGCRARGQADDEAEEEPGEAAAAAAAAVEEEGAAEAPRKMRAGEDGDGMGTDDEYVDDEYSAEFSAEISAELSTF
jgi:hypothetical protein